MPVKLWKKARDKADAIALAKETLESQHLAAGTWVFADANRVFRGWQCILEDTQKVHVVKVQDGSQIPIVLASPVKSAPTAG